MLGGQIRFLAQVAQRPTPRPRDWVRGVAIHTKRITPHPSPLPALLETAASNRHDTRLFVRQIDLIGWQRAFHRRRGRLAAGLFAGILGLGLACRQFGLILGLLPLVTLLGARFDLRTSLGQLLQPLLAPRQLVLAVSTTGFAAAQLNLREKQG